MAYLSGFSFDKETPFMCSRVISSNMILRVNLRCCNSFNFQSQTTQKNETFLRLSHLCSHRKTAERNWRMVPPNTELFLRSLWQRGKRRFKKKVLWLGVPTHFWEIINQQCSFFFFFFPNWSFTISEHAISFWIPAAIGKIFFSSGPAPFQSSIFTGPR